MSKIIIDKKIPSVKVDRKMIIQLENYFINNISELVGIDKETIIKNYSIEISDSLGTEEYDRFSEFPLSLFQNGTEKIKLGYNIYGKIILSVELSFSVNAYTSMIRIRLETNSSREMAQGILNGITERINPYKTYNYFFHKPVLKGVIWGLSYIIIIPIVFLFMNKQYIFSVYLFILYILINLLVHYGEKLKPYCEFDTQKQKRINQIFSFLFWGFISYLIFGLGLGLITNTIL